MLAKKLIRQIIHPSALPRRDDYRRSSHKPTFRDEITQPRANPVRWGGMCIDADQVAAALFAERVPIDRFLEDVRQKVARRALSEFGGNRSRAARAISMDRRTLARVAAALCKTTEDTLPQK